MNTKSNSMRLGWNIVRTVGLCGALAFVMSFASPADDDLQQECRGQTRWHAVRLVKVIHRGTAARRIVATRALPAACGPAQPATDRFDIETVNFFQLPGAILSHHTGDRSPPL